MFLASKGAGIGPRAPIFPLRIHPTGRYFVDQNGVPFPVFDYANWQLGNFSSTNDLTLFLAKMQYLGINAIHIGGTATGPSIVSTDKDGNLPWAKNTSGATFTSTMQGLGDVSTAVAAYWNNQAAAITACQNAGILVICHFWYLGFNTGGGADNQGIAKDLTNTLAMTGGAGKITTFANFLASTFTQPNIIWQCYGDRDPRDTTGLDALHASLASQAFSAASQSPLLVGGHLRFGNGCPAGANNTDSAISGSINVNTVYQYNAVTNNDTQAYSNSLAGSQQNPPTPTFQYDVANIYENGSQPPTGVGVGAKDVRKRWWWSLLTGTAGVGWGNNLTSSFGTADLSTGSFTYANCDTVPGFRSLGHAHLRAGISIYKPLRWWTLLPQSVGAMGTIVTAGAGTNGGQDWVVAAADPGGTTVIAYVPPAHSGSVTIDMTKTGSGAVSYWIDPTTGEKIVIGSFANTGTHAFTTPGNNAAGDADWVLLIEVPRPIVWA